MPSPEQVQAWLDAYVAAWRSYDRDAIGPLFAGDEVIVTGETRYSDGEVFSNLWQLRFAADGRCERFVEWFMLHPLD